MLASFAEAPAREIEKVDGQREHFQHGHDRFDLVDIYSSANLSNGPRLSISVEIQRAAAGLTSISEAVIDRELDDVPREYRLG